MARKRRRNSSYRLTPKRRAALKKAQTASARKRKSRGVSKKKIAWAVGVTGGAAAIGAGVYRHKKSGSSFDFGSFSSSKGAGTKIGVLRGNPGQGRTALRVTALGRTSTLGYNHKNLFGAKTESLASTKPKATKIDTSGYNRGGYSRRNVEARLQGKRDFG